MNVTLSSAKNILVFNVELFLLIAYYFFNFNFSVCQSLVVVAEFTGRMTGSGVKSTPVVRRIPITPRPTIPDNSEVKLGHIFRKKSAEVLSVRIFGFFKISKTKGFFKS